MARRYARDNRGRFAPKGTGATARGGRLKTAGGSKRQTQTMQASAAPRAGAIRGKVKRDPTAASRVGQTAAAKPAGPARTSKKTVSSAEKRYRSATSTARANAVTKGDDAQGRRQANTASARVRTMERNRSTQLPTAPANSPASQQRRKESDRLRRAVANERRAMQRESEGPGGKASRSAAVAKRARQIYSGKIDPTQKTAARLTRTQNPEALRKRIKKMRDNSTAPAKPAAAAAAKPKAKRRRTISPEKTARVTQRVNAVTAAAASKSGVKRMNATEVGVRAKAFLTRKAGGMSGMVGKSFAEQQAVIRSGLTNRPRYSTQNPNRNKPLRFNALGQDRARQQAKIENRTAREKIAAATKKPPAPKPMSRLMGRRELVGRNFLAGNAPTAIKAPRVGSTVKKPAPKAKASNLVVRTRKQSKARQRFRRESILFQTRSQSPGTIGLGAPRKNNPRIRKQQTGMSQLSLIGKAKPLVRFRPVRG
jgi:hypothetical protein